MKGTYAPFEYTKADNQPSEEEAEVPATSTSTGATSSISLRLRIGAVMVVALVAIITPCLILLRRDPPNLYSPLAFHSLSTHPLAVCNDGSPGGFYYSGPSASTVSTEWVINLPGGAQCWDAASCASRWANSPGLMSSRQAPSQLNTGGILDSSKQHNPSLHGAHKASLLYCSSDGYMGNAAAAGEGTFGWHFRGQALIRAMLRELSKMGELSKATLIVFAGESAGARGVMVNVDQLVKEGLFPPSARVVAYLDSPLYVELTPPSLTDTSLPYETQRIFASFNTSAVIPSDCKSAFPRADDQWKCLYGQYRMQFVTTPYFLIASQFDSYQLEVGTGYQPPFPPAALAFSMAFRNLTRATIRHLYLTSSTSASAVAARSRGLSHGYGFYSDSCFVHAVSATGAFTTANIAGVTRAAAFDRYLSMLQAGRGDNLIWEDECLDSAVGPCGAGC